MPDKAVVFVGLEEGRILEFGLDESVDVSVAESISEAVSLLSLSEPDLIISNHIIGDLDSLDFIAEIMEASPDHIPPVVFTAPPGSGIQPFIYERRISGFEVVYLDAEGRSFTVFVEEEANKRDYSVRSLFEEKLVEEVTNILAGTHDSSPGELSREEYEALAWELGMNQELEIQGIQYHVQTEVIDLDPLRVETTVFSSGRALFTEEQSTEVVGPDLPCARLAIEERHTSIIRKLRTGEIP